MTNDPSREGLMPGSSGQEEVLFAGHPSVVPNVATLLLIVLTLGLYGLYAWIRSRGTTYRITTQRIVVERGIFSKRMEQIDLYRVVDYVVERPLGQRMMGTGNVVLEAMDKTTPELRIMDVRTDVVALYERLRYATEAEKRRRGVRLVDVESQ